MSRIKEKINMPSRGQSATELNRQRRKRKEEEERKNRKGSSGGSPGVAKTGQNFNKGLEKLET